MAGYTYDREYRVHHERAGDVTIPDQVFEHMALWDAADMPFPALTAAGQVVEIKLSGTDA